MGTDAHGFLRMISRSRGDEAQIKKEKLETPHVVFCELIAAFRAHYKAEREASLMFFNA